MKYAPATIATYSQACRAMNSSVPLVSPPLMTAALIRIAATTPTKPQNSVVLNACLVSVLRRRMTPVPLPSIASGRVRLLVAASIGLLLLLGVDETATLGSGRVVRRPTITVTASMATANLGLGR